MEDSTPNRLRRVSLAPITLVMLVSAVLLAVPGGCARHMPSLEPETRTVGRFGDVRIFGVPSARDGVVFLFSDAGGWDAAADAAAQLLTAASLVVVGVDLQEYVGGLAKSGDGCHYVISEIEALSKDLQRERSFSGYRSPILAGFGQGGALAYAALAQSPAATVAGAAAVVPAPVLFTPVPLCEGAKATPADGGGFRYAADAPLSGWWQSDPNNDSPKRLYEIVISSVRAAAAPAADPVSQLPLIEYQGGVAANVLAVIYSGDGGWRDLDKQIGEILAKDGIPVVGVDCLRYFWALKTPQQVADDLALIIRTYGARWGTKHVLLVGYSFGASVLPFAINRLPADVRDRIVQISLLGLGANAAFQFSVTEWLGAAPGTMPVLPELLKLDRHSIQCFYGEQEEDTLCPSREIADAEIIRTSGGHHFDGDYPRLAQRIVDGLSRRGITLTPQT